MSAPSKPRFDWFVSHIENCLSEINDVEVAVDEDGDYVIGTRPARIYVRPCREPYWAAEAFTIAAAGLQPKAAVLREINQLNSRSATAMLFLGGGGNVIVRQRIHCDGVSTETLCQAIGAVGCVAKDVGILMASMFDGHSPFHMDPATSDAEDD